MFLNCDGLVGIIVIWDGAFFAWAGAVGIWDGISGISITKI